MAKSNVYHIASFKAESKVGFTNDFHESCYELKLLSTKLLFCIASQVNRKSNVSFATINISVEKFAEICGIKKLSAYRSLQLAVEGLSHSYLDVPKRYLDSGVKRQRIMWLSKITEYKGLGEISIKLNKDLMPFFLELKNQYTLFPLLDLCKFNSTYSQRIYMFLCQYQFVGKFELTIVELRNRLGLMYKYKKFKDLRCRVLDIAVEDINKITNFKPVTYELKKEGGRSFSKICFQFEARTRHFPR